MLDEESAVDPAYPTTSPPDPVYPCQTLEALGPPLAGVATPSTWSRLEAPLERALCLIWERLGLLRRSLPQRCVSIHFGRIAVNAHAWERLRAGVSGDDPDPALVEPPATGLQRAPEILEALRLHLGRRQLRVRLTRAEEASSGILARLEARDPSDLDTAELARGPLDRLSWTEILLPWIGLKLGGESRGGPAARVGAAIALERRFGSEVGRRLAGRGVLDNAADLAYLTVEERIRAVHEASPYWQKLVGERCRLIEEFVELEVPVRFWGRPRVEREKRD